MEMSNEHISSVGKKSFIYPDLVDGIDVSKYNLDTGTSAVKSDNTLYNANYHKRMNLTRTNIQVVVPLKSIEFFSSLENILLPPTKIEITIDIESDAILLYKNTGVDNGKVTINNIYLCYEKLTLNAANKLIYTKFLSTPQTIKFYRESIYTQTSLKNREKNVILYETASKPREMFIWFSDTINRSDQDHDSFKLNTSDLQIIIASVVINDNRHVPITPHNCVTHSINCYNELLKYLTNKNRRESTFIDYELFKNKYMILYFDIKNNLIDVLRDSYCKIEFKYILKSGPVNKYSIYSLLLYEDSYNISLINGRSEIIK